MWPNSRAQPKHAEPSSTRFLNRTGRGRLLRCKVDLRIHDGRACSPYYGDSYVVSPSRLGVKECPEQGRLCQYWEAVWHAGHSDGSRSGGYLNVFTFATIELNNPSARGLIWGACSQRVRVSRPKLNDAAPSRTAVVQSRSVVR